MGRCPTQRDGAVMNATPQELELTKLSGVSVARQRAMDPDDYAAWYESLVKKYPHRFALVVGDTVEHITAKSRGVVVDVHTETRSPYNPGPWVFVRCDDGYEYWTNPAALRKVVPS